MKNDTINIEDSNKSIDSYLIPKDKWRAEKKQLLQQAGLENFENIQLLLNKLDKELTSLYEEVNLSISNDTNPHLKLNSSGNYIVNTPKKEEVEDFPYTKLFPSDKFLPLSEILSTVDSWCHYTDEFKHWQQQYSKNKADPKILIAGIIAKGCAIGVNKMARISNQINENSLNSVINWYFTHESLIAANDKVGKLISELDLPSIYQKDIETLHTSSDGQKFVVREDSLNANYSFKYFGQEQGVSTYTFIDERGISWYSNVFSASERESTYVIDGLMHNKVVKSDMHSTDTHGYSEVIFATSYLLGYQFAPRIKNLKKQSLYIFKNKAKSEWQFKHDKLVAVNIIKKTWDDILHLICTIKLKTFKASDIFRRLNSYSKELELYIGLKAFGQISKSIFILHYINVLQLRQRIEKQLNKGELSQKFSRAVAVGDPRGYNYGEKNRTGNSSFM